MIKKYSKLFLLITAFITFVMGIIIGKPLEHAVMKYLEEKVISYEINYSYFESISDAQKYIKMEELTSFNLNLDDPLINTYRIAKIKLTNKGVNISDTLKFNITIDSQFSKIIDIMTKVTIPENKNLLISDSIPELSWSIDEFNRYAPLHSITWQAVKQRIDGAKITEELTGYNIYGSTRKDVGYSQINTNPVTSTTWRIEEHRFSFYKVQALDSLGRRSELSPPLPYPESLAFIPFINGAVIIEPNMKPDAKSLCSDCRIYDSLEHAIENEGSESTFVFNRRKSDTLTLGAGTYSNYNKSNIFYSDDFLNFRGESNLFLPSGLDENSEIYFYVLYKIWPEKKHNIIFNLVGSPNIQVVKPYDTPKHVTRDNTDLNKNSNVKENYKTMLTPKLVSTYLSSEEIYLVWDIPKDASYKGVRIFRTVANSTPSLGEEVYDGTGANEKVSCRPYPQEKKTNNKQSFTSGAQPPATPPPRKKMEEFKTKTNIDKTSSPLPPILTGNMVFHIGSDSYINVKNEKILPYYIDTDISSDLEYIYTLYTYNDKNEYSHPIRINVSLKGKFKYKSCKLGKIKTIK